MKMAKASELDLEMAMELSQFVDELVNGYVPKHAMDEDDTDECECLDFDDRRQLVRVIEALTTIAKKGSLSRVTFGMVVVCDPRNELIDPDAHTLEVHPKFEQQARTACDAILNLRTALKWYADGEHFMKSDASAWDTVSGEPQNWLCDAAGTAMVEDGSLAGMVLNGSLTGAQMHELEDGEVVTSADHPTNPPTPAA